MVDLKTQYLKIKDQIDSEIQKVIDSTAFINGPAVKEFARDLETYLQVKHVIPCGNGTDALQIALMALGLKPGDEVATPSFTYVATVEVIALLGLKPVFVEVNPDTFNMDTDDLEKKITPNTKAIVPVHLYGQCADMEKILQIAEKYQIPVVEDTAQAIGAEYTFSDGRVKKAGTIGTIGCTSFFPSKNLGCYGDGGAIFTNNDELAQKIRMIANHGQAKKYYHDIIGVNSRLDSIQAAVLKVKLPHLDEYSRARNQAAVYYTERLSQIPDIQTPVTADFTNHVYHQYTIKLKDTNREKLQNHLAEKGIPSNIYYPVPVHLQKGYVQYGFKEGDLPVTEELSKIVLSLPIHTEMDENQLNYICTQIENYFA
ncbi:MAG: DegT/DnrJ/EryC1/StrS family aminotransferase [Bacteroidetes bacterium]|nr:MAG: DegT/DnrJ/EryC1/StrS family aminotransferase [Bacteroidota bacterium]